MKTPHTAIAAAVALIATSAFADPKCDSAQQDTRPVANTLRTLVDAGFKFQRVEATDAGCYELKGTNTLGDRVEIYLNPADGTNVRTETKRG